MEFWNCLHEPLQTLDSVKDVFRNLIGFYKVAYCILYYIALYSVSGVAYTAVYTCNMLQSILKNLWKVFRNTSEWMLIISGKLQA